MIVSSKKTGGRYAVAALAVLSAAIFLADVASAASGRVRSACKDDYFRFCPAYAPDTPQLRSCMRQVGKRLSARCVDALVDAGEIRRRKN